MDNHNKFIEEAKQNARTISSEIRELSYIEVTSKETFELYKDKFQRVLELFKTLKPILKEDRENLWNNFQQVASEHRRKQDERKKNRDYASSRKKEVVVATINDAKGYASGDLDALRKAEDLLKIANERMRSGWSDGFSAIEGFFHTSDGKMKKEDLEYCWQIWNETKEKINSRRKEIFSNNYINIKEDLYSISDLAVYGNPYDAIKRIRETRGKVFSLPMSRENKDSLLGSLDEWWRKAQERIQEKKKETERKQKEWEQRKAEKEKKQKEWELRQAEREKKQKEWEVRKAERERKQREWEERKVERERKQREWEERQRERERKQREYEERKLEQARERERKQQEWEERKRHRGGGSRKSGDGCYITTATCLTMGKPDNCLELETIRRFRDTWLSKQRNGNKLISEYYLVAPSIVEAIDKREFRKEIYKNIWQRYLYHFFGLILAKKNQEARTIYLRMVNELTVEFINDKTSDEK
ncbi:MAG: CFI-box-CTERM domain-containing protein [Chitinophagaceae bacterium]